VSNPSARNHLLVVMDAAGSPPQLEAVLRVEDRGQCEAYADVGAMEASGRDA
jgi:hypothetical protein